MKRVLLAEDEPNIVTSLKFLLVRAGFVVQAEDNGRIALATILALPPDLLILDVMLPEIDGIEILRQVRADARTKSLPVIMLTAKGTAETQASAKAAGADFFITKPFANTDVIEAAERLTQSS
ncbi:MAG: response regulator transcription factor [Alphaproteobacteria bacterium]|jgi:DNA-binding response OmpR family regulator